MKASEYLQKRQDFLAFEAEWVRCPPDWITNEDGLRYACAILGGEYPIRPGSGDMTERRAYAYLRSVLCNRGEMSSVGGWNDRSGRTLVEVLDLFDDAIRLAKEAGD